MTSNKMQADDLSNAILDSLAEQIALLNQYGDIIQINAAWEKFARENGNPSLIGCGPGANYLAACTQAQGDDADIAFKAQAGIRSVLDGHCDEFTLEYPCHEPNGEERWFLLRATPLRDELTGAVVSHLDITVRIKAEQATKKAMEATEEANRAKTEFLSRMSHELRTPLNAILGFAQILDLETNGPLNPAQKTSIEHIRKAGWHLLDLINDVLDLAKIEADKMEIYPEAISLNDLLRNTLDIISPLAQSRNISIHHDHPDCTRLFVHADPFRIKQVLLNLFSNAVKYNRESGQIIIHCEVRENHYVRISIEDTGIGIPANELDNLFRPYTRLYLKNYSTEGTGIGLSISRKLVELMGGKIGVESDLGKGSTFWIELIKSGEDIEQTRQVSISKSKTRNFSPKKIEILCIDDSPSHLQLMMDLFQDDPNVKLLPASTPRFGLELAHARKPDLVFLDICLPEMTGFEVLSELLSSADTAGIPVIAISANAMPQEIERALRAGFRRYITKPIDVLALKTAVAEILLDKSAEVTGSQEM